MGWREKESCVAKCAINQEETCKEGLSKTHSGDIKAFSTSLTFSWMNTASV